MHALVTGCAGFIGSHLTESLLADGHEILGVDCFNDNYGRRQKLENLERARDYGTFVFVPVDLSRGDLDDLVSEVDVIFHLAAEPGVRSSWGTRFERYLANNVRATQNLLDAAARVGDLRRFVYASSSSIYGDAERLPTPEALTPSPVSPYGMTKLAGEHLCWMHHVNHGVPTVVLRYFTVFGPRQRPDMAFHIFARAALENRPITLFGNGAQSRDFTFVGDVVDATRAAVDSEGSVGGTFNVGGGAQTSLRDAVGQLEDVLGRELEVDYVGLQDGDVRHTSADTARAREVLSFEPQVGLRDGLVQELEWLRVLTARQSGG